MPFSYDRIKTELEKEQAELGEQLEHLETTEYESIGYSNHMADDATDAFDQAVDAALKRKVEASLEEIEQALTKLDNGTYGLCEACGGRIDRARLEALPQAKRCLECQARREYNGTRVASH
jgi:RNA polymerase-binding transcription factor DksA